MIINTARPPTGGSTPAHRRRAAYRFIIAIGVVSLFADMTYEGARSITGPFLAVLGASGAVVGIVGGAGELLGYLLRFFSGRWSDRTGRYWAITFAGYGINLLAVPLLALAGNWPAAAALMLTERMGKGIRTPARDVLLASAAGEVGGGWAFGLHEALDQTGAMVGPLLVALAAVLLGGYRGGFALLLVPAVCSLVTLAVAARTYPQPNAPKAAAPSAPGRGFPRAFWLYNAAAALVAAGYADFPLIAYRLEQHGILRAPIIPISYAVAMATAALAALLFGRAFDRVGLLSLVPATVISAAFAPLAFMGGAVVAVVGVALWGVGMGAHESVMRAAVATMAPLERRGEAYGTFNAVFGIAWFLGSALLGVLYDISVHALVLFSILAQLAAIPLLLAARGAHSEQTKGGA